jgi:hypothetical protein
MLFISNFKLQKDHFTKLGNEVDVWRKREMENCSFVFGQLVEKHFPYEKKDTDMEEQYSRSLVVIPQERWDVFTNEMFNIFRASHMSNEQKAEAIRHLLIHIEK